MKNFSSNKKITAISIVTLLLLWEGASLIASSPQLLPSPWATAKAAVALLCTTDFLKIAGLTVLRSVTGFAIAAAAGVALGLAAGLNDRFNAFFRPWIVIIRSIPVIAFALLAIIWLNPGTVPILIGFLAMFPIIYLNTEEGIRSIDAKTVEMARFYSIRGLRLVKEVLLPAIRPFEISGISTAVGMGWRACVVGEVLSQPQWGIGSVMHSAQTFLQVDTLLAWTIVTVVIGAAFEKIIRYGYRIGQCK